MVWHVNKYKIIFKLVISHWTNEMSFSTHSRILFSSAYFNYKIFIHEKMLRKLNWQLPGEPLAAWYNWCPEPGTGPRSGSWETLVYTEGSFILTPCMYWQSSTV